MKAVISAKAKTLAKRIAEGMAEALDYDSNFDGLVKMTEQPGILTKEAEKLAAAEVAKSIGFAMKRYWR